MSDPFRIQCDRCGKQSPFCTHHSYTIWFCVDCAGKEEVLFEGSLVKVSINAEIKPGDIYLARRNTGWKLLTCRENRKDQHYVAPVENAYPYDTDECFKVVNL